jgi:hypothetical protein
VPTIWNIMRIRLAKSLAYMMAAALGVTPSALLRRAETIMEKGE